MIKDYYSILKSFMHHYCLEEDVDISLETIRKAENRRRWQVKKNRKNLMQENVRDVFSHR